MAVQEIIPSAEDSAAVCSGFCGRCGREHRLGQSEAYQACLELMAELEGRRRIDLHRSRDQADPRFSTDLLFGESRGKMFGVMVCRRTDGTCTVLRAFSGQYSGAWLVDGWVGPLFSVSAFATLNRDTEPCIKALGREIDVLPPGIPIRAGKKLLRRQLSQKLMAEIHFLYTLTNFRGQVRTLAQVVPRGSGIPTGTGDCCAPKLLNHAARNDLVPLGIAEFYWGKENRSGTRQHGRLYPPCRFKCRPILGFMLCGLDGSGHG